MIVTLSHSLRTPLNCSINLAKILKTKTAENLKNNFVDPIYSSNRILLSTINNMIDFS